MTAESILFVAARASAILAAWIATYAIHSTIVLSAAWIASRFVRNHATREILWKTALTCAVFTATAQSLLPAPPLLGRYDASALIEKRIINDLPLSRPSSATPSMQLFHARLPDVSETLRFVPIMLVLLWSVYALIILLRVFFAAQTARAALGGRDEASEPSLAGTFQRVLSRFRIRKPVRLTVSSEVTAPVVLGASEVCIPDQLPRQLTTEEQENVLAHEVAHIVRRDPFWLLAAVTIESILFFQPLNRIARARMQEDAEYLADDLAVRTGGNGVVLARCLARVAEWMSGRESALMAPAFVEQRSSLIGRVKSLLDERPVAARRRLPLRQLSLAAVLPLLVLFIAPGFTSGGSRGWGKPAFRWEGTVAGGKSIEIKTLMGNVRAEQWDGRTVLVTATRHGRATDPDISFAVVNHPGGTTVCTIYPVPAGAPTNSCEPGRAGRDLNTPANDVEIDYLVKVPSGVGFAARTATGDISSSTLDATIVAQSSAGDISVATDAYAGATSMSGNVTAHIGSTTWPDTLRIATNSGNIRVFLPPSATTAITAYSNLGAVNSDFRTTGTHHTFFERMKLRGSLGSSAFGIVGDTAAVAAAHRVLLLETVAGGISIRSEQARVR
jgi:beta-lactamase regulating signal transducer with metallopeptidase domain